MESSILSIIQTQLVEHEKFLNTFIEGIEEKRVHNTDKRIKM